jgi:hypothetical protein
MDHNPSLVEAGVFTIPSVNSDAGAKDASGSVSSFSVGDSVRSGVRRRFSEVSVSVSGVGVPLGAREVGRGGIGPGIVSGNDSVGSGDLVLVMRKFIGVLRAGMLVVVSGVGACRSVFRGWSRLWSKNVTVIVVVLVMIVVRLVVLGRFRGLEKLHGGLSY